MENMVMLQDHNFQNFLGTMRNGNFGIQVSEEVKYYDFKTNSKFFVYVSIISTLPSVTIAVEQSGI